MQSLEEIWEQKGKKVLITPESEIEIIKFEDTKNEQHEEKASFDEPVKYVTNEKIEKIKKDIQFDKDSIKQCKKTGTIMISMGALSAIAALLATKHSYGSINFHNTPIIFWAFSIPSAIVGSGIVASIISVKDEIRNLEYELTLEQAKEISLIKR